MLKIHDRRNPLPHFIGLPCVGVKDAACPVDCIHSNDQESMYFIDPSECIDCSACISVCPVEAIFTDDDIPEGQEEFLAKNEEFFQK